MSLKPKGQVFVSHARILSFLEQGFSHFTERENAYKSARIVALNALKKKRVLIPKSRDYVKPTTTVYGPTLLEESLLHFRKKEREYRQARKDAKEGVRKHSSFNVLSKDDVNFWAEIFTSKTPCLFPRFSSISDYENLRCKLLNSKKLEV